MSWTAWRDTIFMPSLHPAFSSAFAAFVQGHRREVTACDKNLDAALPGKLAEASRLAGQRLITGYTVPNAEKLWMHYRDRVGAGEAPGHFAVALAVRAAAFHLPQPLALSTLLFLEARGGNPDGRPGEWSEMIAAALPREGAPQLRAA
jgi:urease accessory protein UreF